MKQIHPILLQVCYNFVADYIILFFIKRDLFPEKETISNNKGSRYFLNDLCNLGMDNNRNVPSYKRDS